MILTLTTEVLGENLVTVPLRPPQIPRTDPVSNLSHQNYVCNLGPLCVQ